MSTNDPAVPDSTRQSDDIGGREAFTTAHREASIELLVNWQVGASADPETKEAERQRILEAESAGLAQLRILIRQVLDAEATARRAQVNTTLVGRVG